MLCLFGASFLTSCQKELDSHEPEQPSDYLTFKDFTEMRNTINKLESSKTVNLTEFNKGNAFVSMQDIFNQAIGEETEAFTREEKYMIPYQAKDLPAVKNHLSMFEFPEFGSFKLKIAAPDYAHVLNADGVVKIGNTIFQFVGDQMKMIEDLPNRTNEIALLKAATKNDEAKQIYINKVKVILTPLSGGRTSAFDEKRECFGYKYEGNTQRFRLIACERHYEIDSYNVPGAGSPWVDYQLVMEFDTYGRSAFGSWGRRNSNEQKISGTFTITGTKYDMDCSGLQKYTSLPNVAPLDVLNLSNHSYFMSNEYGNSSSMWRVIIFSAYGPKCNPSSPIQRGLKFHSSSHHLATWTSYCDCPIPQL